MPENVWQGAMLEEGGEYALMGTTMAPGFDFDDHTPGCRKDLIRVFPERRDLIIKLTNDD